MVVYNDYYPFGMPMPDRNSFYNYRYAYQGQEKDTETGKEAFELRLWDARIGRWLTTDPYGEFYSPYLGMGNNPISTIDPDGGCTKCPNKSGVKRVVVDSNQSSPDGGLLVPQIDGQLHDALSNVTLYGSSMKDNTAENFAVMYNLGHRGWDPNGLGNQLMNFSAVTIGGTLLASSVAFEAAIGTLADAGFFSFSFKGAGVRVGTEAITELSTKGTDANLLSIAGAAVDSPFTDLITSKYEYTLKGEFRSNDLKATTINFITSRVNGTIHNRALKAKSPFLQPASWVGISSIKLASSQLQK